MALPPRRIVREYILSKLASISEGNGYSTNIGTVELLRRLPRDLSNSDLPAIVLSLGSDRPSSETQGGNLGNVHFREWSMDLTLYMRDNGTDGDQEVADVGERFLADVQKCLIANRLNIESSGKPSDIRFDIASNEFERMENGFAQYSLGILVRYDFRLGDL